MNPFKANLIKISLAAALGTVATASMADHDEERGGPFIPGRVVVSQVGNGGWTENNDYFNFLVEFDRFSPWLGSTTNQRSRRVITEGNFLPYPLHRFVLDAASPDGFLHPSMDGRDLFLTGRGSIGGWKLTGVYDANANIFGMVEFWSAPGVSIGDTRGPGAFATFLVGGFGTMPLDGSAKVAEYTAGDRPWAGLTETITGGSSHWGAISGGRNTFAYSNGVQKTGHTPTPAGLYVAPGVINAIVGPSIPKLFLPQSLYPDLAGTTGVLVVNDRLIYAYSGWDPDVANPDSDMPIHMITRSSATSTDWKIMSFNLAVDQYRAYCPDLYPHQLAYDPETNEIYATTWEPYIRPGEHQTRTMENRLVVFPAGVNPNPDGRQDHCRLRMLASAGFGRELHGVAMTPNFTAKNNLHGGPAWRTVDTCDDTLSNSRSLILFEDGAAADQGGTVGSKLRVGRGDPLAPPNAQSGNTYQLPFGVVPLRMTSAATGGAKILCWDREGQRAVILSVDPWLNINGYWTTAGGPSGFHPVSLASTPDGGVTLLWSSITASHDGPAYTHFVQDLNGLGLLTKSYIGPTNDGYHDSDHQVRDIQIHPLTGARMILLGSADGSGQGVIQSLDPKLSGSQAPTAFGIFQNSVPDPDTQLASITASRFSVSTAQPGRGADTTIYLLGTGAGTLWRVDAIDMNGQSPVATRLGTAYRCDRPNQVLASGPGAPVRFNGAKLYAPKSIHSRGGVPNVGLISLDKVTVDGRDPYANEVYCSAVVARMNSQIAMDPTPKVTIRLLPGIAPLP